MGALKYVKWPVRGQLNEMTTKDEWTDLDAKMRVFISERIVGLDTQEAVFALGELMAEIHAQKTKTRNEKAARRLGLQHDYALLVYDHLFERIL